MFILYMPDTKSFPHAPVFVFSILLVASIALVWDAKISQTEHKAHEQDRIVASLDGAAELIQRKIDDLRRSVLLFARSELDTLKHLSRHTDDYETLDSLIERVGIEFPYSFTITLANPMGKLYLNDFDGNILDACKSDIRSFAEHNHPPNIAIHPNSNSYHFDIMVPINLGDNKDAIFFVSFRPSLIVDILKNKELIGHSLILTHKEKKGLIEITSDGARNVITSGNYFLSETILDSVQHSLEVKDTHWQLSDLPNTNSLGEYAMETWIRVGTTLLVLLSISILMMKLLSRSNQKILQQNQVLINQSKSLLATESTLLTEKNRTSDLLESMVDAYVALDRQWNITDMNKQAEIFFYSNKNELVGHNMWDKLPETASFFYKSLQKAMVTRKMSNFSGYYPPQQKWFETRAYPTPEGMALIIHDITEIKEEHDKVIDTELRVNAIINSTSEGIFTTNYKGTIESFNQALFLDTQNPKPLANRSLY